MNPSFLTSKYPAYSMSALRFAFCSYVGFAYIYNFVYIGWAASHFQFWMNSRLAEIFEHKYAGLFPLEWLAALMILFLLLSALGFGPRWLRRVTLLLTLILFSTLESVLSGHVNTFTTNVLFYVLLTLTLAPSSCQYSARELTNGPNEELDSPSWPLLAAMTILPLVFLNALLSQIQNSGWRWTDGTYLRGYFFDRHLYTGDALPLMLAKAPLICLLLSLLTQGKELLFGAVLFSKVARKWLVLLALFSHVAIWLVMKLNFSIFCASFLVYLDYIWVFEKLKSFRNSRANLK